MKRFLMILIGVLVLAVGAIVLSYNRSSEEVGGYRRYHLMGTSLEVHIDAEERSSYERSGEAVARAFAEVEGRWSTWREDSELARVHAAAAGTSVTISDELEKEWRAVMKWSEKTGGVFQPLVGGWLDPQTHLPSKERREGNDFGRLTMMDGFAWRDEGVRIAEGGFAKGLALDLAMERVRVIPGVKDVELNIGGQLALTGFRRVVFVAHPRQRTKPMLEFVISSGSVATSGNSERAGHVLDPRTGEVCTELGSFTVWAPSGLAADCLSTAGLVLGREGVELLADEEAGIACLYISAEGRMEASKNFPKPSKARIERLP